MREIHRADVSQFVRDVLGLNPKYVTEVQIKPEKISVRVCGFDENGTLFYRTLVYYY